MLIPIVKLRKLMMKLIAVIYIVFYKLVKCFSLYITHFFIKENLPYSLIGTLSLTLKDYHQSYGVDIIKKPYRYVF